MSKGRPKLSEDRPCKLCLKCPPEVTFGYRNGNRHTYCVECKRLERRIYYQNNRAEVLEKGRIYAANNPLVSRNKAARWRKKHPIEAQIMYRKSGYKKKYGLTLTELDLLWNQQEGKCGICQTTLTNPADGPTGSQCCVDHDHDTGEVRGLLCTYCNTGIGNLRDDPEILMSAVDWVQRTKKVLCLIS